MKIHLTLAIAVTVFASMTAEARFVRFERANSEWLYNEVYINGGVAGETGDVIDLDDGTYNIFVKYKTFKLIVTLVVSDQPNISAARTRLEKCTRAYERIVSWEPNMRIDRRGVIVVYFAAPKVESAARHGTICNSAEWSEVKSVTVKVGTTPPGANISANGTEVGRTPATVIVPLLRRYDYAAWLVLKKPGFASCLRTVPMSVDTVLVECKLKKMS